MYLSFKSEGCVLYLSNDFQHLVQSGVNRILGINATEQKSRSRYPSFLLLFELYNHPCTISKQNDPGEKKSIYDEVIAGMVNMQVSEGD